MSESGKTSPKERNQLLSILGILGCMLIFLFILMLTYMPGRDVDPLAATVAERKQHLGEVRARATREMRSVGIEDASAGLFKIPVDQAMELTIRDYKRKQDES